VSVLFYKIWYDLWESKTRTFQVVSIIAVGAAALGMIIGTRNLIIPPMQSEWQAINPAMINIGAFPALDDNELLVLGKTEGVTEIEGFSRTTIEWKVKEEDEWSSGQMSFRTDYENQKLTKLALMEGNWPRDDIFAIETGMDTSFDIPKSDTIYLRVNDKKREAKLDGVLYNQIVAPASFGGQPQFYVTRDHYEKLTGERNFTRFMISMAEYDEEAATKLADLIQERLEKQDKETFGIEPARISDPNKHFFQDNLDGLFSLLGVLSILTFILGLLLVYNTINAIITQQVNQIGVMKAIGATRRHIFGLYLGTVLIYGVLGLIVSIPLGAIGAWAITDWLLASFNTESGSFTISPLAMIAQTIIALIAPLVIALIPIFNATRITVREAIMTYGLNTKSGFVERFLAKTKRISLLVLVTISNTFRNKWRVVLMQVTLVMSGLIFVMVVSVRDSVNYTIGDILFSILNFDVSFILERPERIDQLEELTLKYLSVTAVEMWGLDNGTIRLQGAKSTEDDEGTTLFGVPLPTQLYGYQLRQGRWLTPDDTYAIVLNQELAEDAGVGVGDWITVTYSNKKEKDWQVVGLIFDPILTNSAHLPRAVFLHDVGQVGKAQTLWIQIEQDNMINELATAKELRAYYKSHQVDVSPVRGIFGMSDSATETAQAIINQFNFIVVLLGVMAIIMATVGSIALSGSLSLSVLERRREIGVLRAVGASSWHIARLFIGEGLILGWLSWLISLPFGIPAGQLMLYGIEEAFNLDLVYKYSPNGAIYWLVIITVLSILASWLPARKAIKISVRESLAYQ